MIKYPYQIIRQRLLTISALKAVDYYNGQYQDESGEAIYGIPCVFIEFLPIELQDFPQDVQAAEIQIRLHLVTEYYDGDNNILSHMDIATLIYQKLSKYTPRLSELPEFSGLTNAPTVFNSMIRTGITTDHSQSGLVITIQEFKAWAVDLSNIVAYTDVNDVNLTIAGNIVDSLS